MYQCAGQTVPSLSVHSPALSSLPLHQTGAYCVGGAPVCLLLFLLPLPQLWHELTQPSVTKSMQPPWLSVLLPVSHLALAMASSANYYIYYIKHAKVRADMNSVNIGFRDTPTQVW